LAAAIPYREQPSRWRLLVPAVVVLLVVSGYGYIRMNVSSFEGVMIQKAPPLRVALTQGNYGVYMFPEDPEWYSKTQQQYIDLSRKALDEAGPLDLIVWPETVCIHRLLRYRDDFSLSPETTWEGTDAELGQMMNLQQRKFEIPLEELSGILDRTPLLLGISIVRLGAREVPYRYNSAVLVGDDGEVKQTYDKIHLVIFGEYVPFSEYLPSWVPIDSLCLDTARGEKVTSFEVGPYRLVPNICFESSVPHYIRHQVSALRKRGQEPDFLVNLTNAGWFWFTNEMDQHLAANIFRAVECRKPHLVAANCGFSCWIDGSGRVVERGRRKAATYVLAEVTPDARRSWYVIWGDIVPQFALLFCGFLLITGIWGAFQGGRRENREKTVGDQS
jgi:apolipoprotein N-acyltransferase